MSLKGSPSHFLDKQTFFALAIIFISWILWERYMREKYRQPGKNIEQVQVYKTDSKPVKAIEKKQEEFFHFEDKNWKLTLSSKGMGIKKVFLKDFLSRNKKNIQLRPAENFLFFEIQADNHPLYFNVEQVGKNIFKGQAQDRSLKVLIHIQQYSINYDITLDPASLQIVTGQTPQHGSSGLIQGLLSGVEPGLSLFVKNVKTTKRILYVDKDEVESLSMPQVEVVGLGTRYFGQAFCNLSHLLPHLQFEGRPELWKTQVLFDVPKQLTNIKYTVFFGPKSISLLEQVHPQLVSWINFGFLSWLAKAILWFLQLTFMMTQNWGLSIIFLTVLVRILLFPLNFSAYRSMKVMKKIQPEMQNIRSKHKDNPQKMNQEIMALMKRNKAQPLGGCIPMLLQFPIFFALYRVLGESFELYQAPFFGWIQDLSIKDPFYILPVLMGASMYFQQKITPTNMDPAQEKVLKILPIIFTFFMINLPSGLTLYIFVSTLFGLIQQYYFTKSDDLPVQSKVK